jgi:hypothetical protein
MEDEEVREDKEQIFDLIMSPDGASVMLQNIGRYTVLNVNDKFRSMELVD